MHLYLVVFQYHQRNFAFFINYYSNHVFLGRISFVMMHLRIGIFFFFIYYSPHMLKRINVLLYYLKRLVLHLKFHQLPLIIQLLLSLFLLNLCHQFQYLYLQKILFHQLFLQIQLQDKSRFASICFRFNINFPSCKFGS